MKPRLDNDRWWVLVALTAVYALNIADRFVLSTLVEPIKHEFALSDAAVGTLTGAALALFYVTAGIPLGLIADRGSRKKMVVASLAAWSALTMLCGWTRTFWQLFLARIGVGIGEAGGTPPSQSLLSDKFPPRSRALAMSLFTVGAAAGSALGSSVGGWLSDAHGWRTVLRVFGLAGLPLALIIAVSVREPRRGQLDAEGSPGEARFRDTLSLIARQRSLQHILAGITVITFWGWGLLWWTPAFLLRSHAMSLTESGARLGMMHAIGGTLVSLLTAWLMYALSNKDPRHQSRVVGIATLVCTPISIVAYYTSSTPLAIAMLWIFIPSVYLNIGPTLALSQNLVPATARSQIVAIVVFVANVANLAIAPMLIGFLSDVVGRRIADPAQSLRWVLVGTAFTGLWAAWHYFAAARHLDADLARVGTAAA